MSHIHWVTRQNKLEIPNDEEEVNTREIHKCDGQAHDSDTMVAPLTPKPTQKAEALAKAPPTIASRREEDVADFPFFFLQEGVLLGETPRVFRRPRAWVTPGEKRVAGDNFILMLFHAPCL